MTGVGRGVQCWKITERVRLGVGGGAWKDKCLPSSPFTATSCMKVVHSTCLIFLYEKLNLPGVFSGCWLRVWF